MPPNDPTQYELWADLSTQNRHLRRNNWIHWGMHAFLVGALVLSNIRPLMAIRVDHLGRADLVSTAAAVANDPAPEEAHQFARSFATYTLEVTSGSVSRDLGKALAMMTSNFQKAYRAQVQTDGTLTALEKGNVRSELVFDDANTLIKAEKDEKGRVVRYFVTLGARLNIYRADILTAPLLTRELVIRTTLLAVPRSSRTLNGLLVDFFEKEAMQPAAGSSVNVSPLPAPAAAAAAP